MRRVTLTPSSLERYATNGVQRSVTPDAFSAGTTAKVSSGYLAFQSCAEALLAVKASAAAPAGMIRRLIMTSSFTLVSGAGDFGPTTNQLDRSGHQSAAAGPEARIQLTPGARS